LPLPLPFLILWFASPYITRTISFPIISRKTDFTVNQILFYIKHPEKFGIFFETFVGEKDNWLPPDNYQETPVERIAQPDFPYKYWPVITC